MKQHRLIFFAMTMMLSVTSPVIADHLSFQVTPPNIKGKDDRITMPSNEFPWSAVGRINNGTGGHCSGVMIGPSLAISAAHCLYNNKQQAFFPPNKIHFVAGNQERNYIAHSIADSYIISKKYRVSTSENIENAKHDWALILLQDEIGYQSGWFGLSNFSTIDMATPSETQSPFLQAGYSKDRGRELTVHIGCALIAASTDRALIFHQCDAINGDSGGPIFYFKDSLPVLMGIHVATTKDHDSTVGIAVPTSSFIQRALERSSGLPALPPQGTLLPTKTVRSLLSSLGYDEAEDITTVVRQFQLTKGAGPTGRIDYDLVGKLIKASPLQP